jgi:Family of unknown function (DUF6308)
MANTTLRLQRRDGGVLVVEGAALARAFFELPAVKSFEEVAGTTRRDAITTRDIEILNRLMGARSPHHLWEPLVGKPQRWLQRIDPQLDLIEASERKWREVHGDDLVRQAVAGCIGPGRNIAVSTKLLHLKRPRLFPMLDRLLVELLGPRARGGPEADGPAGDATDLVLHLRAEGRANLQQLKEIQRLLRGNGTDVPLVRILDAVLWASHPAAGSISTRTRVLSASLS